MGIPQRRPDTGLRLIILYKLIKAALGLTLAMTLAILLLTGEMDAVLQIGGQVRRHFAGAWSAAIAHAIGRFTTRGHLWFVTGAVGIDAVLTSVEGWSLYRGWWWGPWLVVVATATLLPFEVAALVKHAHAGRFVVLCANVAVVIYLAARTARKHRGPSLPSSSSSTGHPGLRAQGAPNEGRA